MICKNLIFVLFFETRKVQLAPGFSCPLWLFARIAQKETFEVCGQLHLTLNIYIQKAALSSRLTTQEGHDALPSTQKIMISYGNCFTTLCVKMIGLAET